MTFHQNPSPGGLKSGSEDGMLQEEDHVLVWCFGPCAVLVVVLVLCCVCALSLFIFLVLCYPN